MIGTYFHRQNVEKPPKNKTLTLYITKLVSFYHCGVPEPTVSNLPTIWKTRLFQTHRSLDSSFLKGGSKF